MPLNNTPNKLAFGHTVRMSLDAYRLVQSAASQQRVKITDLVSGCMSAVVARLPEVWDAAEKAGKCPYDVISEALDDALRENPR